MTEDTTATVEDQQEEDEETEETQAKLENKLRRKEEMLAEISATELECEHLELEWSRAKSRANACKKDYEDSVSELRSLIRDGDNGQNRLPFPEPVTDPGEFATLEVLKMTEKKIELLKENDIKTVCGFEQAMREDRLLKISGIGQKFIDDTSDALIDWRLENPVPSLDDEEETKEEPSEDSKDSEDDDEPGGGTVFDDQKGESEDDE